MLARVSYVRRPWKNVESTLLIHCMCRYEYDHGILLLHIRNEELSREAIMTGKTRDYTEDFKKADRCTETKRMLGSCTIHF